MGGATFHGPLPAADGASLYHFTKDGSDIIVGWSLTIHLRAVYGLLLTALLMTFFYALLSWRSYAERERFIEHLRPFVASQRLTERLLHLVYQFIVYDGGKKKIARYQQYFTVRSILERIRTFDEDGARLGGGHPRACPEKGGPGPEEALLLEEVLVGRHPGGGGGGGDRDRHRRGGGRRHR